MIPFDTQRSTQVYLTASQSIAPNDATHPGRISRQAWPTADQRVFASSCNRHRETAPSVVAAPHAATQPGRSWRQDSCTAFHPMAVSSASTCAASCCGVVAALTAAIAHSTQCPPVASENLNSCVSMVQSAEDRMRNNAYEPLDWACAGRILPERNVNSYFIVIGAVFRKNLPKVLFAEND